MTALDLACLHKVKVLARECRYERFSRTRSNVCVERCIGGETERFNVIDDMLFLVIWNLFKDGFVIEIAEAEFVGLDYGTVS